MLRKLALAKKRKAKREKGGYNVCFSPTALWLDTPTHTSTHTTHTHTPIRTVLKCNKIAKKWLESRPQFLPKNLFSSHFPFVYSAAAKASHAAPLTHHF